MNDYKDGLPTYTPLVFNHEICIGRRKVPILVFAPYRVDPDESIEISNTIYAVRYGPYILLVEPTFEEFNVLSTEATILIRTTTLLP